MQERHDEYMKRRLREEEEYEDQKWEEHAQMLDSKKFIFESDGQSVFKREFGAPYTQRVLIKSLDEDDEWNGYDDHMFQEEESFEFKFEIDEWKYNEEALIKEFKAYVESTYDQHYSQNKYQATEIAIEAGHGTGFCIGNILKYAQRYGRKGNSAEARKDIMKIMHYALIQLYIHDNYES